MNGAKYKLNHEKGERHTPNLSRNYTKYTASVKTVLSLKIILFLKKFLESNDILAIQVATSALMHDLFILKMCEQAELKPSVRFFTFLGIS